jgi:hypothetical protein
LIAFSDLLTDLLTWASMFGLLGASVEVCTEVVRVRKVRTIAQGPC